MPKFLKRPTIILILEAFNYICEQAPTAMRHSLWLLMVLSLIVASSCIPNKDLVYLQQQEDRVDSLQYAREVQKPYRVQIDDILNIRVKALDQEGLQIYNPVGDINLNAQSQERAYFDGFKVDLHGNIRVPVLGELNVLGYTTREIEEMLEKRLLEDQFKEAANIFVTVKLAGLRFTALGEVGSPGQTVLFKDRVNVLEAVAQAGEINFEGNRKDVLIIRQYPQGQQIHHIDLTDAAVMESPYYYIQPNDMIYVKPLKQKSFGTGTEGFQTILNIATIVSITLTTILLIDRL
jgi:polysaccharide export outer membrane protein